MPVNDNLPLKVSVKDEKSGIPFTGYIVKKKNKYYYRLTRTEIKINRSINIMHDKFKGVLDFYSIDPKLLEPFKVMLQRTFENLSENNSDLKRSLSQKINDINVTIS